MLILHITVDGHNEPRFHSRVSHRAYGPKDVHPGRTLVFVPPNEFKRMSRRSTTESLSTARNLRMNTHDDTGILNNTYPSHSLAMGSKDKSEVAGRITA